MIHSLEESERIDHFQERCKNNFVNMYIRNNFSYTTEYNEYYNNILEYIKKYDIFNDVKIVQLNNSAENGYPHTRPKNIICLPNDARFPSLEKTLFHEVVHIHQRNNETMWERFLNNEGWNYVNEEKLPERWRNMCRLNPDTITKQFYSFQKRYVPLPLFIKDSNIRFSDVKVMYYDMQTGVLEHNTPKGIIDKYGTHMSQPEHPYEIYAVILAEKYPFSKNSITQFLMKGS
jgi:hypothetical protein